MAKTKITTDDLGQMISKEFAYMHKEFDVLHAEIGSLRSDMNTEIGSLRSDMNRQFSSVRADILRLSEEIEELKDDLIKERTRTVEDVDLSLKKIAVIEKDLNFLKSELKKLKTA